MSDVLYYQVGWEGECDGGGESDLYKREANAMKKAKRLIKEGWECVQLYTIPDYETQREWINGEETDLTEYKKELVQ